MSTVGSADSVADQQYAVPSTRYTVRLAGAAQAENAYVVATVLAGPNEAPHYDSVEPVQGGKGGPAAGTRKGPQLRSAPKTGPGMYLAPVTSNPQYVYQEASAAAPAGKKIMIHRRDGHTRLAIHKPTCFVTIWFCHRAGAREGDST